MDRMKSLKGLWQTWTDSSLHHPSSQRNSLFIPLSNKSTGPNAYSGSDIWTLDQSVEFYRTFNVDGELGFAGWLTHKTHRHRSIFNPPSSVPTVSCLSLRVRADISLDESVEDREILKRSHRTEVES
ncbi:xylose isomerase TIM barrel [Colletotrichum orchidophilum]|uniref:Xylose isomerase TIM barrel n=1 Tax=Colletotrichum orchidophilum TaxID=1209926 RepID=A0A1G4BK10_9PEZI|nr:xylose isomerase TIM barrel [Colletotrichum orchidophilum]OHF01627.1 xylose isomerase TIM barrel [Colletotrichum orchidophilum]